MYLIVILIALVVLQFCGAQNPLHRDELFRQWQSTVGNLTVLKPYNVAQLIITIAVPVVIILFIALILPTFFWFLLAVLVLLYSLGRGDFAPDVHAYTLACSDSGWQEAIATAKRQGVDVDPIATNDWPSLNQKMLEATAYQGFERLFAVLFWFILFGPAGALLYRLSFLYLHHERHDPLAPQSLAARWLWALEWPAVRVLGFSFAITGNFVGCINRWKNYVLSAEGSSACVLRETVLGALSVDDELMLSCDCTQREVAALKRLYSRTLWFWVGCVALGTLLY